MADNARPTGDREPVGTDSMTWQRRLYEGERSAGWDPDLANTFAEEVAHLHEELSEAFRAFRLVKNPASTWLSRHGKPEGVPMEFADVVIGLAYLAELHGFDLLEAVERKHAYNVGRSYTAEGRQLPGRSDMSAPDRDCAVPIPRDDAARKALFDKAGLTADERAAVEAAMGKRRCVGIVVSGFAGGSRQVSGCHQPPHEVIDGQVFCFQHGQERRYQKRQFESMMARSTRHTKQIGVFGKGVHCSCGKFVPDGDLHPWHVPAVVEDHLDALLAKVPLESYGRDVQEAVAAFHNGSSHPLLDKLADECRAIELELRAGHNGSQDGTT